MPCVKEDLVFGNKGEELITKYLKKLYKDLQDLNEKPDVRFTNYLQYSIFDFLSEKKKTLIEVKTRKSNIRPNDYKNWFCEGSKMKKKNIPKGYKVVIYYIFTSVNETYFHRVKKNEKFYDEYYTDFSRIQIGRDFVSRQIGLPPKLWKKSKIVFTEEELDELKKLDSTFLDLSDLSWMDDDE